MVIPEPRSSPAPEAGWNQRHAHHAGNRAGPRPAGKTILVTG
jgi:hypothetical protein